MCSEKTQTTKKPSFLFFTISSTGQKLTFPSRLSSRDAPPFRNKEADLMSVTGKCKRIVKAMTQN